MCHLSESYLIFFTILILYCERNRLDLSASFDVRMQTDTENFISKVNIYLQIYY